MEGFSHLPNNCQVQPERYTLNIPTERIAELKLLLSLSPIAPETFENSQPKFGVTRDWLAEAKDAWLNKFDWGTQEARINSFPNFTVNVPDPTHGDTKLHFVALFSRRPDAIPIMFMHGWPGSFLEFLPLLTLLAQNYTPETLPYHAIVPSLPGYTLSSGPSLDKNFNVVDLTRIMNQFMITLGFGDKGYVAQGGDVGSIVARYLSTAKECRAIHVNSITASREPRTGSQDDLTDAEKGHWQRNKDWLETGLAYAMTHGSKPGTIGLVLSTSPLALLAWIGEKLRDWVDGRYPLSLDTMLTMVTLYWFTQSLPRCIYPYRDLKNLEYKKPEKPFGYSYFPAELSFMPAAWCKDLYPDMARYEHDKGGHFAALEQPELLLGDVEDFVARNLHLFV